MPALSVLSAAHAAGSEINCAAAWISSLPGSASELRFVQWEAPAGYQAYAMAGADPSDSDWEAPGSEGESGNDPRYRFGVGRGWVYVVVTPEAIPELDDYAIFPQASATQPAEEDDSKGIGDTGGPVPASLQRGSLPEHWRKVSLPTGAVVCRADF